MTTAAVPNATIAFLDAAVEDGHGARRALVTPAGATSYDELLALVERAGAGLRSRGVKTGDRVAILLPDGLAWAATFFGALRAGAVAIPLNTRLAAPALAALLADSGAAVLVAAPELSTLAREAAGSAGSLTVLDPDTLKVVKQFPTPMTPDGLFFGRVR